MSQREHSGSANSATTETTTESDPGFNLDFQINHNPDPDVYWITPTVSWIHCLVDISRFAKFCKNLPEAVRDMVRNSLKCPFCNGETRGQSNLTKNASQGARSPVRGHPRGSKFVPLNSWGRGYY